MANQGAIQRLIASNQYNLARTKAINNNIAKMEVSEYEQNKKLAALGSKAATKLIGDFHTMRMDNLQSEAYNDFYENQYKDYLNTEEAIESEKVLKTASESSAILHGELGKARQEGVPGDIITKAADKHPMYGATYAKLHLGQLSGRFEGYVRSAMAKDTTMLTLPDVIDPQTQAPKTFQINQANTYGEKLAAHRYLRGQYFKANNIGSYGKAFLSLGIEKGGSGFLQTISNAEHGKDGMYARYAIQSDIYASNQRIDLATQAFHERKTPETFQGLLDAFLISIDENGSGITPEKAWKKMDTLVESGLKGGQITQKDLIGFADAIVPGSKSTKYPNGQTYAQKWPNRFGYENGKFGSYMQTWQRELIDRDTRNEQTLKIQWPGEVENGLEAISQAATKKEGREILHMIREKYGSHDDFNEGYGKLYKAVNNIGKSVPEVEQMIADAIEFSKTGQLTPYKDTLHPKVLENSEIQNILNAEKIRQESGYGPTSYKTVVENVRGLVKGVVKTFGQDFTKLNGDQLAIVQDLEGYFDQQVEITGSTTEALKNTTEYFRLNGGYESDLKDPASLGLTSNKFSLNGQSGLLVNKSLIQKDQLNFTTPEERTLQVTKSIKQYRQENGGTVVKALSAIVDPNAPQNANVKDLVSKYAGLPVIPLTEEPNKESADYNKILWETRQVPNHLIRIAKENGIPLSDVIQARLTAWGHGDLDPRLKEMLGTDLIKYLPGGMKSQVFKNDLGVGPYVPLATIASQSPNPNAILESNRVTEQFSFGSNNPEANNLGFAIFESMFGLDGLKDLTDDGALFWSESVENALVVNPDFIDEAMKDPDVARRFYSLTGDIKLFPVLPGVVKN